MNLIILDRDGVINEDSDDYIKSPDEWIPIPGSTDAIARLNHAGYTVVVATNQSGIARGYFDIATLDAMHDKLHKTISKAGGQVDAIFYCPHAPQDNCSCRKPKPGMLHEIAKRFSVSVDNTLFVGDSNSDIQAARNAGATPVLVRTGKGSITESKLSDEDDIAVFDNLAGFVEHLLNRQID